MFERFKLLLDEADCFGTVVSAIMGKTDASINIISENGERIRLTLTVNGGE